MIKQFLISLIALVVIVGGGAVAYVLLTRPGEVQSDEVWYCPMEPFYKVKHRGICPYCNMPLEPYTTQPGHEGETTKLVLTPRQIQQTGVRTEELRRRTLIREIDAPGITDYDHGAHFHVDVRFGGWIVQTFIEDEGVAVSKGDPMVTLYSPEVVTAQEELLLALKRWKAVEERPAEDRERQRARRNFEATRNRFSLWDIPRVAQEVEASGKVQRNITLYCPADAVVLHRNIVSGKFIADDHHLFDMAPMDRLWVFADVFPRELASVTLGMPARIKTRAVPGRVFEGRVDLIEPFAQAETQSVRVRVIVDNVREPERDWLLKAHMAVRVLLEERQPDVLAIPESAVISTGRRDLVVVAEREDAGHFLIREVKLGRRGLTGGDRPDGDRGLDFFTSHRRFHEVLAGVDAGELVVLQGAFLLHSESQIRDILQKMLDEQPPARIPLPDALMQPTAEILDAYIEMHDALARNQFPPRPDRIPALATSMTDPEIAGRLKTPVPTDDLKEARRVFGVYTSALEDLFKTHAPPERLFVFYCGMAAGSVGSPTETWYQRDKVRRNPFGMGACGTFKGEIP